MKGKNGIESQNLHRQRVGGGIERQTTIRRMATEPFSDFRVQPFLARVRPRTVVLEKVNSSPNAGYFQVLNSPSQISGVQARLHCFGGWGADQGPLDSQRHLASARAVDQRQHKFQKKKKKLGSRSQKCLCSLGQDFLIIYFKTEI